MYWVTTLTLYHISLLRVYIVICRFCSICMFVRAMHALIYNFIFNETDTYCEFMINVTVTAANKYTTFMHHFCYKVWNRIWLKFPGSMWERIHHFIIHTTHITFYQQSAAFQWFSFFTFIMFLHLWLILLYRFFLHFYTTAALLAIQSAVLATAIPSVCCICFLWATTVLNTQHCQLLQISQRHVVITVYAVSQLTDIETTNYRSYLFQILSHPISPNHGNVVWLLRLHKRPVIGPTREQNTRPAWNVHPFFTSSCDDRNAQYRVRFMAFAFYKHFLSSTVYRRTR